MIKQSDVIVTRDRIHGTYECAALVDGTRVSRVYYFYTKRESVRRFTREVNKEHEDKYQPKTGVKCSLNKRKGYEQHRIDIRATRYQGHEAHQAKCSCGWLGRPEFSQLSAENDGDDHVITITRHERRI